MSAKINVKKLKKDMSLADYEKIINSIGIPIYQKLENQWQLWTGDKNKDPYSGSPKLYFYIDNRIFVSYTSSCSYDIISLVQTRKNLLGENYSFLDAVNYILGVLGKSPQEISQSKQKIYRYDWRKDFEKFIRFRRTGTTLDTYDKSILSQLSNYIPYPWLDEGITEDTMKKYQIGYYDVSNSTTIPVFSQTGELVGIRTREWNEDRIKQFGKYHPLALDKNTIYKFPTNNVLFGLNWNWPNIASTGRVIICEGEKSVLKLDSIYGEKSCAVAQFGSHLGLKRRNQLLKLGASEVIIVADCDFIGKDEQAFKDWQKKILSEVDIWKGMATVSVVWDDGSILGPKENALDKDKDTWFELLEQREVMSEYDERKISVDL